MMSERKQEKSAPLLPRLRFPEFQFVPGWEVRELGLMTLKVGSGITPLGGEKNYKTKGRPFIRSQNVGWGEFLLDDVAYIDEETHRTFDSTEVEDRDVLLNITGASIGRSVVADLRVAGGNVNQHVCIIRVKPSDLNPVLLNQYLISDFGQKQIDSFQAGGNRQGLNFAQIRSFEIPLPLLEREQRKIADCLTSLDEVIAAQGRKMAALKAHKRGLMQQLFPREGETRPRLRFPEFRDAPEWEETTIGEIGKFYYGKSAPKWSLEADAPTRCVRYGELYTKFGAVITETFSRTNIDPKNLRFSKGGEILVPRVGEKAEDFGKCCCYLPLANVAIGEMVSVFETAQIPLFYTYYFRNLYRQFAKVVEGQNVKNLYYTELEPLAICRPSLEEQQNIADCLSSLDTQITAESNQLAALKIHKWGLMQQLFPAPEAVGV